MPPRRPRAPGRRVARSWPRDEAQEAYQNEQRAADPSEDAAPLKVSVKNSFLHVGLSDAEAAGMPMRLTQTQDSLPLLELSRLGPAHARMSASMASLPEFDTDEVRTSMLNEESKSMASLPGLDIHTVASLPDFHSMEGLLQLPGSTAAASDGQGLRVDTLTTVGEFPALPADQPEPDGFIVRNTFVDFPVEGIVARTRPVHTIDCLPRLG